MRLVRILFCFAATVTLSSATFAQTTNCGPRAECAYQDELNKLLGQTKSASLTQSVFDVLAVERYEGDFLAAVAADSAFAQLVNNWEQGRLDKQVGPTATTGGTTNLVSKPSTSQLAALAFQVGALSETVSGSTVTVQTNADGFMRALTGAPISCLWCDGTPVLKGINLSAAFDMNRNSSQTVATTGAATPTSPAVNSVVLPKSVRQLSSFTARYDLYNPLDPRSQKFKDGWAASYNKHQADLQSAGLDLAHTLHAVLATLVSDPAYKALRKNYAGDMEKAAIKNDKGRLFSLFDAYMSEVVALGRKTTPDWDKKVALAVEALARYSQLNYDAVQEARGTPQFTFEYTFNRPVSQPETHDFRLIAGLHPGTGLVSLNVAGTVYSGTIPAGAHYGRVKDFQFAAEFDRPLGDMFTHPATLSVAGYVQYQFDPSVLNIGPGNLAPGTNITLPGDAKVLLGTKGTLGIVQAKITIDGKSGLKIPIGVSWANKTDLLNAKEVRGHIGISYDFDSIKELVGGR